MRKFLLSIIISFLITSCTMETKSPEKTAATNKNSVPANKGYADINGLRMYYEVYGTGNPLVLVHGGGSTIESNYGRIIPSLAAKYKVIAVELQAHGRTSDRDTPESFEQDADDVAALMQHLKITRAYFLGFSNGGNTVLRLVMRHPEFVSRIIIASAFYKRKGMLPGFFEGMKHVQLKDMPQGLKDAYLAVAPDSSGLIRMFEKDRDRMVGFKDWNADELKSIKVPALIIGADHDVVLPEHTVEMYRLIEGSRLAIFPGLHGQYLGEVTTGASDADVQNTVNLVNKFLSINY